MLMMKEGKLMPNAYRFSGTTDYSNSPHAAITSTIGPSRVLNSLMEPTEGKFIIQG